MAYRKCSFCGEPTYHQYDLCKECYEHKNKRKNDSIQRKREDEYKKENQFFSHTELYKNIHLLEVPILFKIFEEFGWVYAKKNIFGKYNYTEFDLGIEEDNWDLFYRIKKSPEKIFKSISKDSYCVPFLAIEYKSSVTEWGKKLDDFIRQIKKRQTGRYILPILLSFDERFLEYESALQKAGVHLVVIPIDHINEAIKELKNIIS